jgi:hypothetical protein
MSDQPASPIVRANRVVWRDRGGLLHGTSLRFRAEAQAQRFAGLLRRDPAVMETRILPVVLRPLVPPCGKFA